jgi:DNA gyrase/topoisomerase IV subunit A
MVSLPYIDNKEIAIEELMKLVTAPDFPTGGIIYGVGGVREAYRTGRGKVVVTGKGGDYNNSQWSRSNYCHGNTLSGQ